jgi:hypothetical protein
LIVINDLLIRKQAVALIQAEDLYRLALGAVQELTQ